MAAPPGGLGAAPAAPAIPAPGGAPSTPHNFQRCGALLAGVDATLDYVRCDATCSVVKGLPEAGWTDASSILPGQVAAPILTLAGALALHAHCADWDAAFVKPMLDLSDLTACFSLAALDRFADAYDSMGVFSKASKSTRLFAEAAGAQLHRLPSPSPFENNKL